MSRVCGTGTRQRVQLFVDIFAFVDLVMRGLVLVAQSLAVGGVAYLLLLNHPLHSLLGETAQVIRSRCQRLIFWSALTLGIVEIIAAGALATMLLGTLHISAFDAIGADAIVFDLIVAVLAAALAAMTMKGDMTRSPVRFLTPMLAAAILFAKIGTSHAASRNSGVPLLVAAEFLHLTAVSVWIGGIPYFLIALKASPDAALRSAIGRRFSLMSVGAVLTLVAAGAFMGLQYVGAPQGLYGTNYGVLLCTKVALLGGLLLLGACNFVAVRRLMHDTNNLALRLVRFAETEIGVGFIVLFCAAALASAPLAVDLVEGRASFSEVVDRLEPRLPIRFESPPYAQLSILQQNALAKSAAAEGTVGPEAFVPGAGNAAPRNTADIEWAEANHHFAGLFVLAMGVLAFCERRNILAPLTRHWPLAFLALALFLIPRADEAVWPMGDLGFFESLRDPQIAQHKLIIVLIAAFAIFEWRVRLGKFKSAWPAMVFPLTTALAAAFLLTHYGHSNLKDELLIAVTHTPIALIGVAAAGARWLELRLDGEDSRIAGMVWPIAFVAAGVMLLFYREA